MTDDELIALIANRTNMARQSAFMLCVLWQAKGRIITQTGMCERMFDLSGERPNLQSISACLKRMRRKLQGLPITVVTYSGIGWKVVCADPVFEWSDLRNPECL